MKQLIFSFLFVVTAITASAQLKAVEYIDVENFNIKQLDVDNTKALVGMDIRLFNPNHHKIKIKDADIDVFINGTLMGKVTSEDKLEAPANDTCLLPVTLTADIQRILPNALQLVLSNGIADLKLTGSVKAGRYGIFISIPISYEGKQDIGAMLNLK